MVMAIGIVVTVVSVISLMPLMNSQRVTNAYNMTLAAIRQARDNAVAQQTSYQVTFTQTSAPTVTTITVAWAPATGETVLANGSAGGITPPTLTYQYPMNVVFLAPPAGTPPPDGYGTGTNSVDFGYTASNNAGGATTIYFCPDGSAQTTNTCAGAGNWDGGVLYLARSGDPGSYRAVSLWGATGRVHGWRLYPQGSGYQWLRQ